MPEQRCACSGLLCFVTRSLDRNDLRIQVSLAPGNGHRGWICLMPFALVDRSIAVVIYDGAQLLDGFVIDFLALFLCGQFWFANDSHL